VLTNFDPQPDNPDHNHCWNIYEFIHGWRTFGYPVDSIFTNIFEAHAIPVFLPGDTNDDVIVNIFDITRIIYYLYLSGTPPVFMSAADVNADCTVDVLDISYIVDYLYTLGPDLLVGCYNLYP